MRRHVTNRTWMPEQERELRKLVAEGASAMRAAARLRRTTVSVQVKAKDLGISFVDRRVAKRQQLAREAEVRRELGLD